MPQKRNPVALEHARALGSKALGQAGAILLAVHNTPFGDIVDTEDDLQPLVASMFKDATRAVTARGGRDGDGARSIASGWRSARELGWITVTELADTLTRDHGVPFKDEPCDGVALRGRSGASALMSARRRCCARSRARSWGVRSSTDEARLAEVLSPRHFVRVRTTPAGRRRSRPRARSPRHAQRLAVDEEWMKTTVGKLRRAEELLRAAAAAL